MVPTEMPPREQVVIPRPPEPVAAAPQSLPSIPKGQPPAFAPLREPAPRQNETMRVWLQVIGIAVPLVAGFVFATLDWAATFNGMDANLALVILVALSLVTAGVGAYLLRTWWSLAIAPVAFLVGILLTDVVGVAIGANLSDLVASEVSVLGWYLAPALIGAAIGTALALRGGRWLQPHEGNATLA